MVPAATNGASANNVSFEDYLALNDLRFEWADSYDSKAGFRSVELPAVPCPATNRDASQDWERLRAIIAPTLRVNYTKIGKGKWEAMSADDFIAMASDPDFLGDPCVKTQHLLGASRLERISDTEIVGHHKIRAAHQVYAEPELKNVKLTGHSHATNDLYYKKVDGVWKFSGLSPMVRWNENNFEKVFKGSYKH